MRNEKFDFLAVFLNFVDFPGLRVSSNTGMIDSVVAKVSMNHLDEIEWGIIGSIGAIQSTDMEIISEEKIVVCGSFSGKTGKSLCW